MNKYFILILLFCSSFLVNGQQNDTLVLKFNEYLGYVKRFHPIAKQVELALSTGQANL